MSNTINVFKHDERNHEQDLVFSREKAEEPLHQNGQESMSGLLHRNLTDLQRERERETEREKVRVGSCGFTGGMWKVRFTNGSSRDT